MGGKDRKNKKRYSGKAIHLQMCDRISELSKKGWKWVIRVQSFCAYALKITSYICIVCDARQLVGLWNRYKIEPLQLRLAIEQFIQMQFINGPIEIDELGEIAGTLTSQRLWVWFTRFTEILIEEFILGSLRH